MNFELDEKVIYNGQEVEIIDVDTYNGYKCMYLVQIGPDNFKWVGSYDLKKKGEKMKYLQEYLLGLKFAVVYFFIGMSLMYVFFRLTEGLR